jgi:hypothetical protein
VLTHNYSYEAALADSLKIGWQVDDLIGAGKGLDFSRPFMPERLAGVRGISCLSDREKLLLNQIRGHSYLRLFAFCEEFILPYAVGEAAATTPGGDVREVRAMLRFAEEEAKHIQLFRRFAEEFAKGFPTPCPILDNAADVAKLVLSHSRLGVALLTLSFEWETQTHYIDSIKDDQDLDPQFKSLLRHHWMEEAQHAKLDTLVVDKLASAGGPAVLEQAFKDLAALGMAFDGLLQQQVLLDLEPLQAVIGRKLSDAEKEEIVAAQRKAYRYTFLVSGLEHKNFLAVVGQLHPGAVEQIKAMAGMLSS